MQRTAQDWLVLTELTQHDATSVGIVMALQFGPQLLFLPWTGFAADHFDRRKLLMVTQATMALLSMGLGMLVISGTAELWQVYVFAFLFGCASAFDVPARQTFITELVSDADLSNAVALNSTTFNAARMVGPAVAGVVIAAVGTGWAFVINAGSFAAVLIALILLRRGELFPSKRAARAKGSMTAGFRYVMNRPDLKAMLVILFLIGTFGLNFPLFISTMAVKIFHADAQGYGLLSSFMAVGTISGALLAAGRDTPRFRLLPRATGIFGAGCLCAALAPGYWWFAATLVVIGVSALTILNTTNSLMQLTTDPEMRGRVTALRVAIVFGGTPIGAPIVGWVADTFGPRWALGFGAMSGFAAALVALAYLARARRAQRYGPDPAPLAEDDEARS